MSSEAELRAAAAFEAMADALTRQAAVGEENLVLLRRNIEIQEDLAADSRALQEELRGRLSPQEPDQAGRPPEWKVPR